MDTLNHAVAGYCLGLATGRQPVECAALAFAGALPDVIGEAERAVATIHDLAVFPDELKEIGFWRALPLCFQRNRVLWNWYNFAHDEINTCFLFIAGLAGTLTLSEPLPVMLSLSYFLHVGLDTITHDPGKEWWVWPQTLWIEILSWIIMISFLLVFYL